MDSPAWFYQNLRFTKVSRTFEFFTVTRRIRYLPAASKPASTDALRGTLKNTVFVNGVLV